MEEKLIGGGTDDQGGAASIEERYSLRVQGEAMYEYGSVIEDLHAIEIEDLLRALCIDSFCRVQHEGQIGRSVVKVVDQVWIHLQRMRPAKPGENTDGEVGGEQFARKRVVMADGGYAAEQIADGSPPKTNGLRHLAMTSDERGVGAMDLFGPFDGVLIRSCAEIGKEAELKVIMCVDEAGKQQISGQIDDGCRRRCSVGTSWIRCLRWNECVRVRSQWTPWLRCPVRERSGSADMKGLRVLWQVVQAGSRVAAFAVAGCRWRVDLPKTRRIRAFHFARTLSSRESQKRVRCE